MARKSSRRSSRRSTRGARRSAGRTGARRKKNNVGFLRKSKGPSTGAKKRPKVSALPAAKRGAINKKRRANARKKLKPLKTSWSRRTKTGKVVTVNRRRPPKNALPR